MRLFWAGILTTGLFLLGLNVYDRRQARDAGLASDGIVIAAEDGSPLPQPYPTPPPKKTQ